MGQIRSELVNIASENDLGEKEAEAVALIDLSLQSVTLAYLNESSDNSAFSRSMNSIESLTSSGSLVSVDDRNNSFNSVELGRLPRWFRCGLGTIGSAILGGLGGAGSGFTIGGPFGGVVGGILGVIGGTVTGVAAFCD